MQINLNLSSVDLWLQVFVLLIQLGYVLPKSSQLPFILHILLFFRHKRHLHSVLFLLKRFYKDSIAFILSRVLLHCGVVIETSILLIVVAAATNLVLTVCAFIIVTELLSLYLCFQLYNFALHPFILHHNLMELSLRAS